MTESLSKEVILAALKTVEAPGMDGNIVDLGLLSEIVIHGGKVYFSITINPNQADQFVPTRQQAENVVKALGGVERAVVSLTADHGTGQAPKVSSGRQQQQATGGVAGGSPVAQQQGIPGVKHIIAVASGKGGVGKSTTSVNLAMALKANGLKVGILDADIYGPSMPRLLGITGKPQLGDNDKLIPMQAYGVKVMSMGFLIEEDKPMIWRGPMVISALSQMMKDVDWGELDVMVVDMPPGTGDAQLTMAQKVPLAGAVIVSTPQDLALIDARKGLNMFRKVEVPLLGIVENMSYFLCPSCGDRSDIFGHGGARAEAEKIGVPFLGEVPLHMDIRDKSDRGEPVVVGDPEAAHSKVYLDIGAKVWDEIQKHKSSGAGAAPRIVIE